MKSGKHQSFFIIKTTVPQFMLEASWRSTILYFLLANCDGRNTLMQRFYWSKCWECNVVHLQVHKNI